MTTPAPTTTHLVSNIVYTTVRFTLTPHFVANTPPDLIADTDVTSLSGNRGATAFNKLLHKMDDTYHDFKSRLFQQVSERQAADDKRLAQVGARNQQLEGTIASLDEDVAKLTKELEETKSKLKVAEQALSAERRNMRA
jgi:septal ring factor EnvC (AmiA/AmiB activator)